MKLVLLDDDKYFIECFKTVLKEVSPATELVEFTSEDEFVGYVKLNYHDITALLIDIELSNSNGIDLGSVLNYSIADIPIVFVTGYPDKYCQDIFLRDIDLKPFCFLTKPITSKNLSALIKKLSSKNEAGPAIEIKQNKDKIIVDSQEIIYIKSDNKTIYIYTKAQAFCVTMKLHNIADLLPSNFLMPHKSYLINSYFVKSYNSDSLSLIGGHTVPISRNRRDEFISDLLWRRHINRREK